MMWTILVFSQLGMSGLFTRPVLFWLELLALLAGTLVIGLLAAVERREHLWRKAERTAKLDEPQHTNTIVKKAMKASKAATLMLLGVVIGWNAHTIRLFHHTYVLNDVRVLKRHSDNYYLLQTDHHVDFTFRLCSDSKVDWLEGSELKVLVYEDRGSCESVSDERLGYVVKRDPATGWPVRGGT